MGCGSAKPKDGQPLKAGAGAKAPETKDGAIGRGAFITDNPGKIMEYYDMEKKKLGEGSYGSVCKAKNKGTGLVRAVKSISKANMKNKERFQQEILIMKMMDHPNIIKLFETFEDHRNIYLVMEICKGGELFDRIIEAGHFTEVQAAILMQQIIKAIFFMHDNSVCHRDLKPENFLFMSKDPLEKTTLKIIDFGLSCSFTAGQVLTTKAGTPYYVAPQVLAGKYDHLSDLWSVGVIMYVMLCGYPPFFGETDAEVLAKVRLGNFSFNASDWKNVSEDAKNLIRFLLKMNPRDRYTAEQALGHTWIKNKAPKAAGVTLETGLVDHLRQFRSQNKLKKAALQVIAQQLDDSQIKNLRQAFESMDENGDGSLSLVEMRKGLMEILGDDIPADLEQVLKDVDTDGSGQIQYTEFLAASLQRKTYQQEEVCWAAFRVFDKNGDGKISRAELCQVMKEEDVAEILKSSGVDMDGDGEVSFEEFMVMMKQKGGPKDQE